MRSGSSAPPSPGVYPVGWPVDFDPAESMDGSGVLDCHPTRVPHRVGRPGHEAREIRLPEEDVEPCDPIRELEPVGEDCEANAGCDADAGGNSVQIVRRDRLTQEPWSVGRSSGNVLPDWMASSQVVVVDPGQLEVGITEGYIHIAGPVCQVDASRQSPQSVLPPKAGAFTFEVGSPEDRMIHDDSCPSSRRRAVAWFDRRSLIAAHASAGTPNVAESSSITSRTVRTLPNISTNDSIVPCCMDSESVPQASSIR